MNRISRNLSREKVNFKGLEKLADNYPRTIFEIVRCPGNTRKILEFGAQFKKKIMKFQNLTDNCPLAI